MQANGQNPPRGLTVMLLLVALLGTIDIDASENTREPVILLESLFDPGTNAQSGAWQGYSVAMDGNLAVVGAPGGPDRSDANDWQTGNSGVVKIYNTTTGALLYTLTNPSPPVPFQMNANTGFDWFGRSVAISGTRVAVAAPNESIYSGFTTAMHRGIVYVYDLAAGTLPIMTLNAPATAEGFGYSLAMSGTRIIASASGFPQGRTYVYDLASAAPSTPTCTLTNFGWSLATSGPRVVVGSSTDDTEATDAGSAYVYDLTSATPCVPLVTLSNPNPGIQDHFGSCVAIAGNRVAVGAPDDSMGLTGKGTVYVYDLSSESPTAPTMILTNSTPAEGDVFGNSVALSGTKLVIGGTESAYVYDLSSATPAVPIATLNDPTPAPDNRFGYSVAAFDTRILIGAPYDDTVAPNAGSAYLYDLANATPAAPVAALNQPSPAAGDWAGTSVAISGSRVVVGAIGNDTGAENAGSAYVYDLASASPRVPVATLHNPNPAPDRLNTLPAAGEWFGQSVGIFGTLVAVAAPRDGDGMPDSQPGSAYVYDLASTTPTVPVVTLKNPSARTDSFGQSLAISGTKVVVGAPFNDTRGTNAGIAYVYDLASARPSVPWITLTRPTPVPNDWYGWSVAIDGMRVVVGVAAPAYTNVGGAYVYDLASAAPNSPVAILNHPRGQHGDFGKSVGISGTRIIVGSPSDNTVGSAFVYDLESATPTVPLTVITNPYPAGPGGLSAGETDRFAISVAISGTWVVIGAPYDATDGAYGTGIAYLYDLASDSPSVPTVTLKNPSPALEDYFGSSVAVDCGTIIVGAPGDNTTAFDRGAAYVFAQPPMLKIRPAAPGFATVSWMPSTSGFVLQYSDRLAPANWVNAPSGPENPATISIVNSTRFYRLFRP